MLAADKLLLQSRIRQVRLHPRTGSTIRATPVVSSVSHQRQSELAVKMMHDLIPRTTVRAHRVKLRSCGVTVPHELVSAGHTV